MSKPAHINFRPGGLYDLISKRGSQLGTIAKRDLQRYYDAIERVRVSLMFKDDEFATISSILKERPDVPPDLLWASVEDQSLRSRLRRMEYFEILALIDYCERNLLVGGAVAA